MFDTRVPVIKLVKRAPPPVHAACEREVQAKGGSQGHPIQLRRGLTPEKRYAS
jgi:hypothetical protein